MSLLLLLLISIPVTILQGFIISQLWLWFLTPLGVASIGIANAIGIAPLVSLLTSRLDYAKDPDMKGWTLLIGQLIGYLFIWGFGYIVYLFM